VASLPTERGSWFAEHIFPLESQVRRWLKKRGQHSFDTDDLIQEGYAKLVNLKSVADIKQPRAYFYQIIRSLVTDHRRRATAVSIEFVEEIGDFARSGESLSPERIVSGYQDLEGLFRVIAAMPEPTKTAFVLKRLEDLSQKEIAIRMNISEGMVEKRLSQAAKAIMQELCSNK
jgi:RNA polymerase sigma factor (sigma-70 family)